MPGRSLIVSTPALRTPAIDLKPILPWMVSDLDIGGLSGDVDIRHIGHEAAAGAQPAECIGEAVADIGARNADPGRGVDGC